MTLNSVIDIVVHSCRPLLAPHASIIVGVSGGSDSVALLHILHELRESLLIEQLLVAHVNYGLRGEASDADEALVRSLANTLHLPVFIKRVQGHGIDDVGMEAWAREVRYRFFKRIQSEHCCSLVATGHTLEDQAETVLMRLLRGSGINGLRGIAALRDDGVIRPLLELRKEELREWLDCRGIHYRYDVSNSDTRFLRNRIRNEVFPLLEKYQNGALQHCASLAGEANKVWSFQQIHVVKWTKRYYWRADAYAFCVRREGIKKSTLAGEALRQLMVKHRISPDRFHIAAILNGESREGAVCLLPDGWQVQTGKKTLYFEKVPPAGVDRVTLPGTYLCRTGQRRLDVLVGEQVPDVLDAGKWIVYIDADTIAGKELVVRMVTPDDQFIPFGRKKEVGVHHFLSKEGVVKPDRDHTIILTTCDNKPVWLHGIRIDDRFRVTFATKRVIKIQSSSIL